MNSLLAYLLVLSSAGASVYFLAPETFSPSSGAVVKEVRIILPKSSEDVPGRFGVRGYGKGFENEGYIRVSTASRGEVILEDAIYFNAEGMGRSGPFAYTVDLETIGLATRLSGRHVRVEVSSTAFPASEGKKDSVLITLK